MGSTQARVLVPPARPELNPLFALLRRGGAQPVEFPTLRSAPPRSLAPLERAAAELERFDWLLFSGGPSVAHALARLAPATLASSRLVAIGHAAKAALEAAGLSPLSPWMHTAEAVADEIEAQARIAGTRILLVRVEDAARELPEELRRRGAEVTEVDGYRMEVEADLELAGSAFRELRAVAFANPTAVRYLARAARELALELAPRLEGALVATAGPVTAEAARRAGLEPGLIAGGHLPELAQQLLAALESGG